MKKRLRLKWRDKNILLLPIGFLLIIAGIIYFFHSQNLRSMHFGILSEGQLIPIPFEELPPGSLHITESRRAFQRGDMVLLIPSISVETLVGESTIPDGLMEMPGLFEFSQLPGKGDVNVSIAGHRDIYDRVFYHLDKVGHGDYLYVVHDGIVFRYLYKDTEIVHPENWSVIKPQGFSCLTLVTCTPVGTTLNRMVLRAELVDYRPLGENYVFTVNEWSCGS